MKAIILAAGRGSRMESVTYDQPKCLVKLKGKSLLDWQLEAIRNAGIKEIGIVTGYKREKIIDREFTEFFNSNWLNTNMVSSLMCANDWLQSEPCVVSYSDIFYESSVIKLLMDCLDDFVISYDPNWLDLWKKRFSNPLVDAETFRVNQENYLIEIGNKPKSLEEVQGQYMGILKFTPQGWNKLKNYFNKEKHCEFDVIDMTQMLNNLIKQDNQIVKAIPYKGIWGEIDTIKDLKIYEIQS